MTPTTYTPDPASPTIDAARPGNGWPQLPDAAESRAWVLAECEGRTQAEIADELGVTQSSVCRMIARASRKIDSLIAGRWITRELFERNVRRATGLAART